MCCIVQWLLISDFSANVMGLGTDPTSRDGSFILTIRASNLRLGMLLLTSMIICRNGISFSGRYTQSGTLQFQFNFNLFTICIDITKTHFNIIQIQVHIARCCLAYKVIFRQHLHNNIQYIYICDGVCTTCAVQMYVYLILQFNVCGVYVMCCIQYL